MYSNSVYSACMLAIVDGLSRDSIYIREQLWCLWRGLFLRGPRVSSFNILGVHGGGKFLRYHWDLVECNNYRGVLFIGCNHLATVCNLS